MGPATRAKWAPSGAWRMPVGDPYAMSFERNWGLGPFYLVRNLEWDGSRASHQGVDLGSGLPGAPVRAAAAGLVVHTADRGMHGGYGTHVVLAHRLPEGEVAYSVYAHLRVASIRVKPGQFVQAGTTLGRVGMTGRATGPHLHFEIRTTREPEVRWEFGNVEEPLAFIEERLPAHRADSTGVAAFLEWAEFTALLPSGAQGDDPLTHERWWRMLAAASRGPMLDPMLPSTALRDSLVRLKVLRAGAKRRDPDGVLEWSELARDLNHTRRTGLRTGRGPLRRPRHDRVCSDHFGQLTPSLRTAELSGRPGTPTLTDAVLLLADVAGPAGAPRPAKPTVAAGGALAARAGVTTGGATARPTRADSLARRSRAAGATVATRAPAAPTANRRPTRADSLAAKARSATASVVAGSRAGAGSTTGKAGMARSSGAGAKAAAAPAAGGSLARTARPDPTADAASRTRPKSPTDSLARRARAIASADTQARASRARPRADSMSAPRSAPPAASASADSSGDAP